tara:strand:+ start:721 stop:1521 length:801 start_codon:yes stop_codon:yes gene_type:complete
MKVVMLDAYNLIHRARSGYTRGENAIVYNFFRSLRPLIEMHNPDRAYFVLEGVPKHRLVAMPDYKGDRVSPGDAFHRQKRTIISLIKTAFPFWVAQHEDLECDDLIGNLAKYHDSMGDECVVVSGDSDFIQLLDTNPAVQIYHPIKKIYVQKPEYNYLEWKSLCGDKTDNIPGIKGVGAKTAEKLVRDREKLQSFLSDEEKKMIFERNKSLIAFADIENFRPCDHVVVEGALNESNIHEAFEMMQFKSILKENAWKKFTQTFSHLR